METAWALGLGTHTMLEVAGIGGPESSVEDAELF